MTPIAWCAVVLAAALGAGVGALAVTRRAARQTQARTLVPHRTRQVIAALQSGAVVVRRDRRSAYANTAATALGVARTDGKLHAEVANLAEEAWEAGEVVERDVEVSRGVLGIASQVHVRVTPIDDELALAVANDQTEQRALEAYRREFAVNVSHELKTPIGALALLAESIEDGADDPQMVANFARKIRKESRRLSKLIQEIIEISRLQGGESVVDHEKVDLSDVIDEALDAVRVGATAKNIRLERDVQHAATVLGDHDLLLMAVRNLVDNAVAYSEPGTHVTVSLTRADAAAGSDPAADAAPTPVARLAVLDQGIGIAPADAEHVFERFYRADPARSRDTGGTGLGLSIVKHVLAQHGGTVELWSQPSVGSTFTLTLPLHEETP